MHDPYQKTQTLRPETVRIAQPALRNIVSEQQPDNVPMEDLPKPPRADDDDETGKGGGAPTPAALRSTQHNSAKQIHAHHQ